VLLEIDCDVHSLAFSPSTGESSNLAPSRIASKLSRHILGHSAVNAVILVLFIDHCLLGLSALNMGVFTMLTCYDASTRSDIFDHYTRTVSRAFGKHCGGKVVVGAGAWT
jgi:hypothetical protein